MRHGKLGLTEYNKEKATPGYTLFWPLGSTTVHLINMRGDVVHEWNMPGGPGNYAYLLPNGNLLAAVRTDQCVLGLAAKGGHLLEMDWDGKIVWEYVSPYFQKDPPYAGGNYVFRAYRYMADSPEIGGRLDADPS